MMNINNINKARQLGILLVIIGFFIPSILYPFTSLTSRAALAQVVFAKKGVSYETSLRDLEVVLAEATWRDNKQGPGYYESKVAIPYKYTLAFGIVLVFIGIGILALSQKKR